MTTFLAALMPLVVLVFLGAIAARWMRGGISFAQVLGYLASGVLLVGVFAIGPARLMGLITGTPTEGKEDAAVADAGAAAATGVPAPTSAAPTPSPAKPTTEAAEPLVHVPGFNLNWGLVAAIVGGLILLIVVIAVVMVVVVPAYRRRHNALTAQRAEQADLAAARQRLYDSLTERHGKVNAAYTEFLLDIFAILERPALNDVTVASTAAFLDAHARATDLRPTTCPTANDALSDYEAAVRDLDRTWAAADTHARRVGTDLMTEGERRKVSLAISALTKARDTGASTAERQTAYKKAMELLKGIIPIQEQTRGALEIESRQVLALAA